MPALPCNAALVGGLSQFTNRRQIPIVLGSPPEMRPGTAKAMSLRSNRLGNETRTRQGQPPHLDLHEVQTADGLPCLAARDREPTRRLSLQAFPMSAGRCCRSRLRPPPFTALIHTHHTQ